MPLPIKTLPILEQWDCHGCGICCRASSILLNDADLRRLREQHWEKHPDFRGKKILVRAGLFDRHFRLALRKDGTCVFQDADRRCRIHREFGYDAKPHVCRMAPLQMIALEKFAYVTLRRYCPSAAADNGRPMEEHIEEYRRLAVASGAVPERSPPPKLTHGYRRPWKEVMAVGEVLNGFMLDERYPLVRRLVHGLEFCRLLERCRLKKIQGPRLPELLSVLKVSAVEAAGPLFENRVPADRSSRRWFRQIALEYLRLHPAFLPESSWRERGRVIHAAWSYVWGKGRVPCFRMDFPPATFAELERPLGALAEEVMRPLTRYFERAVVSLRYATLNKSNRWSITEGFGALALGFPVAMWMLRFACGPRSPEVQDVVHAVMMLDRGETTASFVGLLHRSRTHSLMDNHQLSRLTAWYAR
ncbi:MAG: YkgJ family cysteine cluster protein [Planctomycetia bacterium]|nr:YkgJ family cysteine cluster protein [Planctomycetia bacterium]